MTYLSSRRILLCLVIFAGALCPTGWAQTFQGSFAGTVTDPMGAVVPGALVTVQEVNKGFSRSVSSDNDGSYGVPLLPPGNIKSRC